MCSGCVQRFVILLVPSVPEPRRGGASGPWVRRQAGLDRPGRAPDGPGHERVGPGRFSSRARGEIHERRCHGLIASSASQRRTVGGCVASGGDLRVGLASGRGQHHPGPQSRYSPRARHTRAAKITHSPGLRVTDTDRPAGTDGASSPPVTPLRPLTTVSPDGHSCGEARGRRRWAP